MPIDFASETDERPVNHTPASALKAIWQVLYPGSEDTPTPMEVYAHVKDALAQKDRELQEVSVQANDLIALTEENERLRRKLKAK